MESVNAEYQYVVVELELAVSENSEGHLLPIDISYKRRNYFTRKEPGGGGWSGYARPIKVQFLGNSDDCALQAQSFTISQNPSRLAKPMKILRRPV